MRSSRRALQLRWPPVNAENAGSTDWSIEREGWMAPRQPRAGAPPDAGARTARARHRIRPRIGGGETDRAIAHIVRQPHQPDGIGRSARSWLPATTAIAHVGMRGAQRAPCRSTLGVAARRAASRRGSTARAPRVAQQRVEPRQVVAGAAAGHGDARRAEDVGLAQVQVGDQQASTRRPVQRAVGEQLHAARRRASTSSASAMALLQLRRPRAARGCASPRC